MELSTKNREIEIRSEEVQEILGTPPGWLLRWGTVIALVTVVALAWAAYYVRYPDTVKASIKVTSTDPPHKVIAENNGMIYQILVKDEDTVKEGRILLMFKSQAKLEDVLELEKYVQGTDALEETSLLSFKPPKDLILGELEDDLYNFLQKQKDFEISNSRRYEKLSIRQLRKQIDRTEGRIQADQLRRQKLEEQLALTNSRYIREQKLYSEKEITRATLQKTREEILTLEREMESIESDLKNKEFEIESIQNRISGVRRDAGENMSNASAHLKESFIELRTRIDEWKNKYLVTSPIAGIAILTNDNVGEQQFILSGTEMMVIVPTRETEVTGKMFLSLNGSGKVKLGQKVIVKFDSYPFPEFGAVYGEVLKKGKVPVGDKIPVEVGFLDVLRTSTGRELEISREMSGTAEIITVNKRFIERIFENVRRVLE